MENSLYPAATPEIGKAREAMAPQNLAAWRTFSRQTYAEGALSAKMKHIVAVAVAHVTQCPYCIHHHTASALQHGASNEEIMEAIWVAAEMRAGAAVAHSALAIEEMQRRQAAK